MTTAATHKEQSNTTEATLFVAFELREKTHIPDTVVKILCHVYPLRAWCNARVV